MSEPDAPTFDRVAAVFKAAQDKLVKEHRIVRMMGVALRFDPNIDNGAARDFAYCMKDVDRSISIYVGTRLEQQPIMRIRGVIWHEFGHAIDFAMPWNWTNKFVGAKLQAKKHEYNADLIAEVAFGEQIIYDAGDVQIAGPRAAQFGKRRRPSYLPQ